MAVHAHEKNMRKEDGGLLIGPAHGATKGFCVGLAIYDKETYNPPGVHADQEGFYCIEGRGMAKVGGEEFEISPGSAFIALAGVPHSVKKLPGAKPVKLVWCHGAV